MNEIAFVLKVSKFCNLRCAYCYEHRELHIRDQMLPKILERLFAGVDAFGDYLVVQGIWPSFSFVWHGGEPLLLPPEFYATMARLQKENIHKFGYRNSVQTNLFGNVHETLKAVLEVKWGVGVSIDFADGVRANAAGRDSNASVIAAAEALHKAGTSFGIVSVLGAHNPTLCDAYDWVAEFADSWRILPVFDGGPSDSIGRLRLPDDQVVDIFLNMFRRRASASRHIPILPVDGYVKFVAQRIAGAAEPAQAGQPALDNTYLVNVNGDVFTRPFAYDPVFCLGNIMNSGLPDMIRGHAYRSCQSRIQRRKSANCNNCEFGGYCDSSPMHEHGSVSPGVDGERCVIPKATMQEIERALVSDGVDRSIIQAWAQEWLSSGQTLRGNQT